MDLQELSIKLADYECDGMEFECFLMAEDVIQVVVDGNSELPIFVTMTEHQILCITYLFDQKELKEGVKGELNETLLTLNVPIPLSAFAVVDQKYAIYGSLSTSSAFDDVAHELVTLADNAIDAIETLEEFLL